MSARMGWWSLAVMACCLCGPAWAATREVGPADDFVAEVAALQPGDELVLRAGTYTLDTYVLLTASGTANAPIVIRALAGARPLLTRSDASQNLLNLNAQHLVLRGLELSGGASALRFEGGGWVTVEDCEIHHTAEAAVVAAQTGVTYEGLVFRRNHVHHTQGGLGDAFLLGCANDGCRVKGSTLERNFIHDTASGSGAGAGIRVRAGSSANVLVDNVVFATAGSCIDVQGALGNGADTRVERNAVWQCGDYGLALVANAQVVNNLVLGAVTGGIFLNQNQGNPATALRVVHNTVLAPTGDALNGRGLSGAVTVANNALYAQAGDAIDLLGDLNQLTAGGNVGVGGVGAGTVGLTLGAGLTADFKAAHWNGAPPVDLTPAAGSSLLEAGVLAEVAAEDFDRVARAGRADVGAYAWRGGDGPSWDVSADFKVVAPDGTGTDGGTAPGQGGTGAPAPGGESPPAATPASGCGCSSGGSALALLSVAGMGTWLRRRRSGRLTA